jgi:hypothetical protein
MPIQKVTAFSILLFTEAKLPFPREKAALRDLQMSTSESKMLDGLGLSCHP